MVLQSSKYLRRYTSLPFGGECEVGEGGNKEQRGMSCDCTQPPLARNRGNDGEHQLRSGRLILFDKFKYPAWGRNVKRRIQRTR